MWLLPALFVFVLTPVVRDVRTGGGLTHRPAVLLLRAGILTLMAVVWSVMVLDQLPCFLGIPNCD